MSIKTISEGSNYTAINVGPASEIEKYVFTGLGQPIPGKVFLQQALHATGSEISYTSIPAGVQLSFFHSHKENEEVYIVIKGKGEYQVDDTVFPIEEGSVIRVGTGASRCYKNTGTEPLVIICIQTKESKEPLKTGHDAEFLQTEPKFTK
ncbi:cupin domain-containing protein [Histomonas meleagridis]|uniref:cupin domain-containing protein n=1 Tax=Histomonas meleagridis TaxID=135588 RepID=UPI00355A4FB7|nr:cupin domain-containing protein [Histomonas meleagridis]KAH0801506.1 cupin domain-containing protein [Histomonas meleagridis]